MMKAMIVDDIQILRQGLRAVLEQGKDIQVVGLAANGQETRQLCRGHKPSVVFMDMCMSECDGSYGIARIKEDYPDMKVLVLTTFDDKETVDVAVGSDTGGYILRKTEDDKVIQSVKAVCAETRAFGGSVFEGMCRQMTPGKIKTDMAGGLTPRERDIIRLVARGMDNREIAGVLFLAEETVRSDISRPLEKLKLKDRTQLAVFVIEHNLNE